MRILSVAAQAIIQNQQNAYFCDLYEITLVTGEVIRWTGAEQSIKWNGFTFLAGPLIARDHIHLKEGLTTDSATLTINPRPEDTVGSQSLSKALLTGVFDSAQIVIYRGLAANPGASLADAIQKFFGVISEVSGSGFELRVSLQSELSKLAQPFPRHVYSPGCGNKLFDSLCGLNPSSYEANVSVSTVSSQTQITVAGGNVTLGWYRGGIARCTSGQNAGRSLRIKESLGAVLQFSQPWTVPLAVADTMILRPGCDKTSATCISKFNNIVSFRGQPFIPAPEMIA